MSSHPGPAVPGGPGPGDRVIFAVACNPLLQGLQAKPSKLPNFWGAHNWGYGGKKKIVATAASVFVVKTDRTHLESTFSPQNPHLQPSFHRTPSAPPRTSCLSSVALCASSRRALQAGRRPGPRVLESGGAPGFLDLDLKASR